MISSLEINTMILVDTNYVIKTYPTPSKDPNRPTYIDNKGLFIISDDLRGIISGQGTLNLALKACVGDIVSIRGTSIYGNSNDAIILFGVKHHMGDNIFTNFAANLTEIKNAVQPGLPIPGYYDGKFISYDSKVVRTGTETLNVIFALYTLSDNGQTQELYGYYCFDVTFSIR